MITHTEGRIKVSKYLYRVVYTGSWERVLYDGSVEKGSVTNQPCGWCKTKENAEKRFLKGVKNVGMNVAEYHIEAKLV